jgi:hypothetical protein
VIGAHAIAGRQFFGADLRQRGGGRVVSRHPDAGRKRAEVADVGQVSGVDQRAVPGIARRQPDPAAACHIDQRDEDRHRAPRRVGEPLLLERDRQHVPLQVRR